MDITFQVLRSCHVWLEAPLEQHTLVQTAPSHHPRQCRPLILKCSEQCGCHLRGRAWSSRGFPFSPQYEKTFSPKYLQNWCLAKPTKEVSMCFYVITAISLLPTSSTLLSPHSSPDTPSTFHLLHQHFSSTFPQSIPSHEGYTQIIANDRGHLLPSVPRSQVRHSPPFLSTTGADWGDVRAPAATAWAVKSSFLHIGPRVPPSCQSTLQDRVLVPSPYTVGDLYKTDTRAVTHPCGGHAAKPPEDAEVKRAEVRPWNRVTELGEGLAPSPVSLPPSPREKR